MKRLALLFVLLLVAGTAAAADTPLLPEYPTVTPGAVIQFPRDHGAHPDFRSEWWYVTGWLSGDDGKPMGFQVTFFRTRPSVDQNNPSAFAVKQVLFAHAALSDPSVGHLLHDQRAARAGLGLAEASTDDTDVVIDDWSLKRDGSGVFHAKAGGADFMLDLNFAPMQAVLMEGENGYSRKGPQLEQASHYYSIPHLGVTGTVKRGGRAVAVKGTAWLDREWSSSYLDANAVGWDWVGFNLNDGSALMAFQIRKADGSALWAGGTLRDARGAVTTFAPEHVSFSTERKWTSPRTGAVYPVERVLKVKLPSGEREWRVKPLFDDQELDSRAAGGPVYWEGAASVDSGHGYLELTGYFRALKL